ncbi:hypothetical protein IMCC26256_11717 [Actinobacteria bacterium IMCC26256]|nr:hypothetical protein IMCC26256_11717 [Actinobacteria bacterium IMCC26256]
MIQDSDQEYGLGMGSNEGISESTEHSNWRIPTPGYGAIFVIIVLALTALLSSCYGADKNPRLSISAPGSAKASSESLLYPARETRWTSSSALPGLGSPGEVYQVVPFESGKDSATNALKSFAEHFGSAGALKKIDCSSSIEVSHAPLTAGDTLTGLATLSCEVPASEIGALTTLSYTRNQAPQFSQGSSSSSGPSSSSQGPESSNPNDPLPPVTTNTVAPDLIDSTPQDIPRGDAVIKIARDVLRSTGIDSSDWLSSVNDASMMSTSVSCEQSAICEPQGSTLYSRQVVLTPLVNSLPVHDLDWYVEIGDQGLVLSAYGAWVKAERLGEYSRRGTERAFTALQAGEAGLVFGVMPMGALASASGDETSANTDLPEMPIQDGLVVGPRVVTIDRVESGYSMQFGAINGEAASLLVPTYTFLGVDTEGIEAQATLNALDPSLFAPLEPTPGIDPGVPDPKQIPPIEPQPAPLETEPAPIPNQVPPQK